MMNILELAMEQKIKEEKNKGIYYLLSNEMTWKILDRTMLMRKYLDIQIRNKKVAINREANKRRVKNG